MDIDAARGGFDVLRTQRSRARTPTQRGWRRVRCAPPPRQRWPRRHRLGATAAVRDAQRRPADRDRLALGAPIDPPLAQQAQHLAFLARKLEYAPPSGTRCSTPRRSRKYVALERIQAGTRGAQAAAGSAATTPRSHGSERRARGCRSGEAARGGGASLRGALEDDNDTTLRTMRSMSFTAADRAIAWWQPMLARGGRRSSAATRWRKARGCSCQRHLEEAGLRGKPSEG